MAHWEYRIDLGDIFRNDKMPFRSKRNEIVKRLRASRWFREREHQGIGDVVDELSRVTTVAEFDEVWNEVYDVADYDRAWIDTLKVRV